MTTLPNELFIPIIESFGSDRSTLFTLLTVSRHFYAIALPQLYREISLDGGPPGTPQGPPSLVDRLHRCVDSTPGLHFTTSIHFGLSYPDFPFPKIGHILPHLRNLRRLSICTSAWPIDAEMLWRLPPTVRLTHLALSRTLYTQRLLDWLALHSTLELLYIHYLIPEPSRQAPPTLPRDALPALRSFGGPASVLQQFGGRRSLVDLNIVEPDSSCLPFLYDFGATFSSVRSLSVSCIDFPQTASLVVLLPNLQYLYIETDPCEMDDSWLVLATTKLVYMRFQASQRSREKDHIAVRGLFELVNTLALVDIEIQDMHHNVINRYHRNAALHQEVPDFDFGWAMWWELPENEIKDAVQRSTYLASSV